jgi:hypothetical protein
MKTLLLILFVFVLSGCAHDNFYSELRHTWEQRQAFYQNATRVHTGSYYSGIPKGLQGWDLEAHMTTKSEELASAVLVSTLSYERVKQWRTISKMRLEVVDCIEMINNHPFPYTPADERKLLKFRRYMESLLESSDMAEDALEYCEREDLELAKDKTAAARAIFYR